MANPIRFSCEEALPPPSLRGLPASLVMGINPIVDYKACLIRLLAGTVNNRCNLSGDMINQRINYSQLLCYENKRISTNTIRKAVYPYSLTTLNKYLQNNLAQNINFHRELYIEFSHYFLDVHKENQTAAFLHLYRILESSAYCFPLIWASRTKDYEGTFIQLRSYFNGEKTGELGVFRRFIEEKIDAAILNTQIKLTITSIHLDWQERYFNTIIRNIEPAYVVSSTTYSEITILCRGLTELLINIRNKYFHFLTGKGQNLNSDDVVDPNEFFSIINESLVNWLSVIFFEIIDYEMSYL